MKTNKFLSILVMLVLSLGMAVSFSSCSSSDDGNGGNGGNGGGNNGILGTWVVKSYVDDGEYEEEEDYKEWTFQNGGKGTRYKKETDGSESTKYFAWKVVGDVLYVEWYKTEAEIKEIIVEDRNTWSEDCKFTISGKKLQLVYDYDRVEKEQNIMILEKK